MTIDRQLQNAKRSRYDQTIINTESFQQRVLSRVRSIPTDRSRSKGKYVLLFVPAMVLLLSGFSYVIIKGTMLKQTPTIQEAVREAPFPIKLPTYIPIHPTQEWGQVSYYGSNSPSDTDISLVWGNGRKSITEDVALTSGGTIRPPRHQQIVQLANGESAIFARRSGSLFWIVGNETYRLTLHPWNAMSVSQLIKIADSVK